MRIKQLVCFLSGWSAYFGSTPTRDEKSQLAPPSTCFGSRARFPPPAPSGKQSKKRQKNTRRLPTCYRQQTAKQKPRAPRPARTARGPGPSSTGPRARLPWTVPTPPARLGRGDVVVRNAAGDWARGPHGQRTKGRERPRNKRAPREKFGGNSSCSLHSTPLPRSRSVGGRTKPPDSLVPRPGPPRPSSILLLACGCGQPL